MDNPTAPIPSTSPQPAIQPEVSSPVESQSRHWPLWLFGGVALLALGVAIGVFGTKFLNESQSPSQLVPTSTSVQSPTPTPTPDLTREPDGSAATADWKTYTNTKYSYSLKYEVNPELKQLSCSSQKMERGEDVFILDENNSAFPECGFGGYSWPISITAQDSIQDCNSTESWQSTKSEIKISGIGATKCVQKFIGQKLYPGPDEITWVGSKHNSKFFVFNLSNPKYQGSFDQILSTFQFLK